jgi:hypothetical protein
MTTSSEAPPEAQPHRPIEKREKINLESRTIC